ncbi:MAG: hypothetical protein B7Z08_08965 [Sphingomonadales bacterium 32-68-7]|nr:MAG: hypothetical protein B7Z08_08965 [Sphingomonadales bacterium 32-68-7]
MRRAPAPRCAVPRRDQPAKCRAPRRPIPRSTPRRTRSRPRSPTRGAARATRAGGQAPQSGAGRRFRAGPGGRRIDPVAGRADAVDGPADLEHGRGILGGSRGLGAFADVDERLSESGPVVAAAIGIARGLEQLAELAELDGGVLHLFPVRVGLRLDVALDRFAVFQHAFVTHRIPIDLGGRLDPLRHKLLRRQFGRDVAAAGAEQQSGQDERAGSFQGFLPAAGAFAVAQDAPVELTAEQVDKARGLFNENGCNACHLLADAEAAGAVGPALDGNANLDKAFVVDRVTNGSGPMPGFGWLDPADIDLIADYIVQVKK